MPEQFKREELIDYLIKTLEEVETLQIKLRESLEEGPQSYNEESIS